MEYPIPWRKKDVWRESYFLSKVLFEHEISLRSISVSWWFETPHNRTRCDKDTGLVDRVLREIRQCKGKRTWEAQQKSHSLFFLKAGTRAHIQGKSSLNPKEKGNWKIEKKTRLPKKIRQFLKFNPKVLMWFCYSLNKVTWGLRKAQT